MAKSRDNKQTTDDITNDDLLWLKERLIKCAVEYYQYAGENDNYKSKYEEIHKLAQNAYLLTKPETIRDSFIDLTSKTEQTMDSFIRNTNSIHKYDPINYKKIAASDKQKAFNLLAGTLATVYHDHPNIIPELDNRNRYTRLSRQDINEQFYSPSLKNSSTQNSNTVGMTDPQAAPANVVSATPEPASEDKSPSSVPVFNPHANLISRMQALEYKADKEGVCAGLSEMAKQAMLADDMATYNTRLRAIGAIPLESFINTGGEKTHSEITKIFEETINKNDPQTDLTSEQKAIISSIPNFFEGIELYFQAHKHPELFEEKPPGIQNASLIAPLVNSKAIAEKGGIAELRNFSGCYNKSELESYFNNLRNTLTQDPQDPKITHPVPLTLGGHKHQITVGYDPKNNDWLLCDANNETTQEIKEDKDIAASVFSAFQRNESDQVIFTTKIYETLERRDALEKHLNTLENQNAWNNLHAVTEEKAKLITPDNFSWLREAIKSEQVDVVRNLIDKGAKPPEFIDMYMALKILPPDERRSFFNSHSHLITDGDFLKATLKLLPPTNKNDLLIKSEENINSNSINLNPQVPSSTSVAPAYRDTKGKLITNLETLNTAPSSQILAQSQIAESSPSAAPACRDTKGNLTTNLETPNTAPSSQILAQSQVAEPSPNATIDNQNASVIESGSKHASSMSEPAPNNDDTPPSTPSIGR